MIRYLVLFAFLAGVVLSNPCKNVKTGQKLQDPTECRGYVLCNRDRAYYRTCTFGTKFDEATQKCVRGKCPPCNCPSVTPAAPETTKPVPNTTPAPTTPELSTTNKPEETSPPSTVHCERHLNGMRMPDPMDCTIFWVCAYDKPVQKKCPAGLWFDEQLKICNWPESAKCPTAKHL